MRSIPIAVALAAAVLAVPATAGAAATAPAPLTSAPCADAATLPAAGNLDAARRALLCLHGQMRARHGLPPLRMNRRLQRGAQSRVDDMVRAGYFDHTSPEGVPFFKTLLGAGYAHGAAGWALAENLGRGTEGLSSPDQLMQAWLASPEHRRNVLRRRYRDVGIGVGLRSRADTPELVVAVEFGTAYRRGSGGRR